MALILEYLQEQLGAAFTKEAKDGWTFVARALVATVAKQYKAMDAQNTYWSWITNWCTLL